MKLAIPCMVVSLAIFIGILGSFAVVGTANSIRDFGRSESALIFNSSLIVAGVIGAFNALQLYFRTSSNLEGVALSLLTSAFLFLCLIGVFPVGTELHVFVCLGFLFSAFLSTFLLAIALRRRNSTISLLAITILLLSILTGILGSIYGIIAISELSLLFAFLALYCLAVESFE